MSVLLTARIPRMLAISSILVGAACAHDARTAREDTIARLLLLAQPADTAGAELRGFAARQQAFLRAMTAPGAEIGEFVGTGGFMFSDWNAPRQPQTRDVLGRPATAATYFTSLTTRIAPAYASVASMEVRPDRGEVIVVVRHPHTQASITRWRRVADSWKVGMLTLNVPDDVVARLLGRGPVTGS